MEDETGEPFALVLLTEEALVERGTEEAEV